MRTKYVKVAFDHMKMQHERQRRRMDLYLIQHRSLPHPSGPEESWATSSPTAPKPCVWWVLKETICLQEWSFCHQYKLQNLRKMTVVVTQKFTRNMNSQYLLPLACSPSNGQCAPPPKCVPVKVQGAIERLRVGLRPLLWSGLYLHTGKSQGNCKSKWNIKQVVTASIIDTMITCINHGLSTKSQKPHYVLLHINWPHDANKGMEGKIHFRLIYKIIQS